MTTIELNADFAHPGRWTRFRLPMAIFLVGLAVGLAMVAVGFRMQAFVDSAPDPYNFGKMGESLARGDGFANFGVLLMRRAPLYPAIIGALYVVFGVQPTVVLVVQCLLLAGTGVLAFDIGRRMFNERTGVIAGLICVLNPVLLRYVADLHLETLLTFLFTLTIWSTVRFVARPTLMAGVIVGVCVALASLTKAVVVLYPFLFATGVIGYAYFRWRRGQVAKTPWRGLVAMFAAMVVVIAPWTIRNYVATGGHVVLISSGLSDAFLRGYIFSKPEYARLRLPPYTYAETESNQLFQDLSASAGTVWERDDYETDQILNRAAVDKLVRQPSEFLRKFVVGLGTFWYQMTSLSNSLVAGGLAAAAWAFALIGIFRARREGQPFWLLILPALYLNVFLAALLALGRYSVPILPALLVMSAFGADAVLLKLRASRA